MSEMSTDRMRVAQVGVGGFGRHRRKTLRDSGLFDLVAAYDWNEAALELCRVEEGAASVESYEELLRVPGIEAVVISTGAKFHAEQVIQAANRGLHVFVEKPLGSTPEEVQALLEAQARTGVVIGVGHNDHQHDAISLTIQGLIDRGEMGAITCFEKTTAHSGGLHIKPGDWRGDPEKNPGGMLFQCGCHAIHELLFHFGPITHVSAMMRYDVHTTATADAAICHLRFASGLIGVLNAYHVTPYRHHLALFGTKANLYRDDRYFAEGTKLALQRGRLDGGYESQEPVVIEGQSDIYGNIRSFYQAIRQGGQPYPSLFDGARAVAAVFAAEESARTGRVVEVPLIG